MAAEKRNTQVTPMPFPGESPTVALAMAAGEKFGYHEQAKPARAKPKRKAAAKSKAKPTKPARKARSTKPTRAKKSR